MMIQDHPARRMGSEVRQRSKQRLEESFCPIAPSLPSGLEFHRPIVLSSFVPGVPAPNCPIVLLSWRLR